MSITSSELEQVVSSFAPLIGSLLPIPGGALIGQIIANAFGGNENTPDRSLAATISAHPQASSILSGIESDVKNLLANLMSSALNDAVSWWFDVPAIKSGVSVVKPIPGS